MRKIYIFLCLIGLFLSGCTNVSDSSLDSTIKVETIHGVVEISDPLIIELINSPVMQRLKGIRQYGAMDFGEPPAIEFNRFEHSLGVLVILVRYKASREEQIAGLLHDASHTVFSHSTDPLFMGGYLNGNYQDKIHERFLEKYGVGKILEKYGLSIEDISPKREGFKRLEQPSPELCADRIDYNLFAAYKDGIYTEQERSFILDSLQFDGENWFFDNIKAAKMFAVIPLWQTIYRWGSPLSAITGNWVGEALKRALEIGLITEDDIYFNLNDDQMWQRLKSSSDPLIKERIYQVEHSNEFFVIDPKKPDVRGHGKFSRVDPWVKTQEGLKRLTKLDSDFSNKFYAVKSLMAEGWSIKWLKHKQALTMFK